MPFAYIFVNALCIVYITNVQCFYFAFRLKENIKRFGKSNAVVSYYSAKNSATTFMLRVKLSNHICVFFYNSDCSKCNFM